MGLVNDCLHGAGMAHAVGCDIKSLKGLGPPLIACAFFFGRQGMSTASLPVTEDCCAAWGSLIGLFGWFRLETDAPDVLVMPCLVAQDKRWRVNHCPSCGASCRDAVVDRTRVEEARSV